MTHCLQRFARIIYAPLEPSHIFFTLHPQTLMYFVEILHDRETQCTVIHNYT